MGNVNKIQINKFNHTKLINAKLKFVRTFAIPVINFLLVSYIQSLQLISILHVS